MEFEEKNHALKRMIGVLRSKAKEDGVITEQEEIVLDDIEIDIDRYEHALNKAVRDGIITDDEKLQLQFIEESLLTTTFKMIERDDKLSQDAKKLVEILFESLMNIID